MGRSGPRSAASGDRAHPGPGRPGRRLRAALIDAGAHGPRAGSGLRDHVAAVRAAWSARRRAACHGGACGRATRRGSSSPTRSATRWRCTPCGRPGPSPSRCARRRPRRISPPSSGRCQARMLITSAELAALADRSGGDQLGTAGVLLRRGGGHHAVRRPAGRQAAGPPRPSGPARGQASPAMEAGGDRIRPRRAAIPLPSTPLAGDEARLLASCSARAAPLDSARVHRAHLPGGRGHHPGWAHDRACPRAGSSSAASAPPRPWSGAQDRSARWS